MVFMAFSRAWFSEPALDMSAGRQLTTPGIYLVPSPSATWVRPPMT
jgi:hypothetical protein